MSTLHHDPTTKQQIKDALYDLLYTPIQTKFQKQLDQLIIRNTILGKYTHKSFTYRGMFYSCDPTPAPRKTNQLVPELQDEMNAYLVELDTLNKTELPYVLGYINQVLNSSDNLPDYLKLLPESVHSAIHPLISSCPSHTNKLPDTEVQDIRTKNQKGFNLMLQRMTLNLLV